MTFAISMTLSMLLNLWLLKQGITMRMLVALNALLGLNAGYWETLW